MAINERLLDAMKSSYVFRRAEDLAVEAGVSEDDIWKYIHGAKPNSFDAERIASALGVSVKYLFG